MKNTFSLVSTYISWSSVSPSTPRMMKTSDSCMVSAAPLVTRRSYRLFRFCSCRYVTKGVIIIGHENALLRFCVKTHLYCIVLTDRPHGSWKRTLLKTGLRVENMAPHSHVDSESTYFPPSPHPSTSDLWTPWHLIATTTTMVDYCLCFLQRTRLVVECESQQQFDLIINPHKRFWFPCTSHFCFRILLLLSVCKQRAGFMRMLRLFFSIFGEFQAPPRGLECVLQRFESF